MVDIPPWDHILLSLFELFRLIKNKANTSVLTQPLRLTQPEGICFYL